jgi:hypothetical protein
LKDAGGAVHAQTRPLEQPPAKTDFKDKSWKRDYTGTDKSLGETETARQVDNNDSNYKTDCGNRFWTLN